MSAIGPVTCTGESAAQPHPDPSPVDALLVASGDPAHDLEILLERGYARQRRAAVQRRQLQRRLRWKKIEQAIRKMKSATWLRFGSSVLSGVLQVAASACGAAGSTGGQAGCQALGQLRPLDMLADSRDRQAQRLQLEGQMAGERAGDAAELLSAVRQSESRMHQQLEAFQRSQHESRARMAAI
ncbi:MAG: hypothetical protein JXR96_25705 [Deltaproteobacteria bacterium]|nr:hypothetical protein [Deltaproteobacteria bacterium]